MAQHSNDTRDHDAEASGYGPAQADSGLTDAVAQQQGSLPDGGDFSSAQPVGGSKPDPVSTGPNVKDSIAGRN